MNAARLSQIPTPLPPMRRPSAAGARTGSVRSSQPYLLIVLLFATALIAPGRAAAASASPGDVPSARAADTQPSSVLVDPSRPSSPSSPSGSGVFTDAEWRSGAPPGSAAAGPPGHDAAAAALSPAHAAGGLAAALCVVLAVIGVGALALRRWGGRQRTPGAGRHLQILDTVHLAPKRSLLAVRVADRVLIVGMGDSELHALGELPASAFAATEAPAAPTAGPPQVPPFARTLASYLGHEP